MKAVIITLALAGLASTAPLNAQILGGRLPTTSAGVNVDGSWRMVGRDGSGNTIYERRTQDRNGNIIVQRARRNSNGSMSVISTQTVANVNTSNNSNCSYNRTSNSVGDIIFGRTNNTVCNDVNNRIDGGWYQVGQGRDNNSIYERRTTDRNGNLIIQRARLNRNGTFTILSTRRASNNDRQWQQRQRREQRDMNRSQRGHDDDDDSQVVRDDHGNGKGHDKDHDKDHGNGKDKHHD